MSVTYTPGLQEVQIYLHSLHVPAESRKTESAAETVLDMQDKQPQLVNLVKPTWQRCIAGLRINGKNIQGFSSPHYGVFWKNRVKYFVA